MEKRQDPNPDNVKNRASNIPYKKRLLDQEPNVDDDPPYSNLLSTSVRDTRTKIEELQKQAYFSVLRAFLAEANGFTSDRVIILKQLVKEFGIPYTQHENFQNVINNDSLIQVLRGDLQRVKEQKAPITKDKPKPLRITLRRGTQISKEEALTPVVDSGDKNREKATTSRQGNMPSSSSSAGSSSGGSWGKVSPESLIGRKVFVRMPGDEEFVELMIKQYDAEEELHCLENEEDTMDDPCSWIDLRLVPSEDIMWEGEDPEISEDRCALKPGETLLHETSTTARIGGSDQNVFKIPSPRPAKKAISEKGDDKGKADAVWDKRLGKKTR